MIKVNWQESILILSCGDLSPHYLSFIATFTSAPVLYVHGNHDGCYEKVPPKGSACALKIKYMFTKGFALWGLAGLCATKTGPNQFSQKEMKKRARKMWFSLHRHKGFDILLAHSPAYKINDSDDLPHMGFELRRSNGTNIALPILFMVMFMEIMVANINGFPNIKIQQSSTVTSNIFWK